MAIFSSWRDLSVPQTTVANRDTIVAIIRDDNRGWSYLYEKLGQGFYDYTSICYLCTVDSAPLYFRAVEQHFKTRRLMNPALWRCFFWSVYNFIFGKSIRRAYTM